MGDAGALCGGADNFNVSLNLAADLVFCLQQAGTLAVPGRFLNGLALGKMLTRLIYRGYNQGGFQGDFSINTCLVPLNPAMEASMEAPGQGGGFNGLPKRISEGAKARYRLRWSSVIKARFAEIQDAAAAFAVEFPPPLGHPYNGRCDPAVDLEAGNEPLVNTTPNWLREVLLVTDAVSRNVEFDHQGFNIRTNPAFAALGADAPRMFWKAIGRAALRLSWLVQGLIAQPLTDPVAFDAYVTTQQLNIMPRQGRLFGLRPIAAPRITLQHIAAAVPAAANAQAAAFVAAGLHGGYVNAVVAAAAGFLDPPLVPPVELGVGALEEFDAMEFVVEMPPMEALTVQANDAYHAPNVADHRPESPQYNADLDDLGLDLNEDLVLIAEERIANSELLAEHREELNREATAPAAAARDYAAERQRHVTRMHQRAAEEQLEVDLRRKKRMITLTLRQFMDLFRPLLLQGYDVRTKWAPVAMFVPSVDDPQKKRREFTSEEKTLLASISADRRPQAESLIMTLNRKARMCNILSPQRELWDMKVSNLFKRYTATSFISEMILRDKALPEALKAVVDSAIVLHPRCPREDSRRALDAVDWAAVQGRLFDEGFHLDPTPKRSLWTLAFPLPDGYVYAVRKPEAVKELLQKHFNYKDGDLLEYETTWDKQPFTVEDYILADFELQPTEGGGSRRVEKLTNKPEPFEGGEPRKFKLLRAMDRGILESTYRIVTDADGEGGPTLEAWQQPPAMAS